MSTNKIAQLSLLSAACVAGRIAFQFIPNFQPMTAIFLFIVLYLSLKDALIVMSFYCDQQFLFWCWTMGHRPMDQLYCCSEFVFNRLLEKNSAKESMVKGSLFFSGGHGLRNRYDRF